MGEDLRKGCRKVNIMEILRTRIWKWKEKRPVETIPGMGIGNKRE
jgi:hypothetical protein